tara:strand:- start:1797 stop:2915 length:1119 start_codon:yes stop_codon:yes gene_type:complete
MRKVNSDFWKGKRVLVTGHTGFKGAWLALWLRNMGAEVLGYSLAPETDPNLYTVAQVEKHCDNVIADIRDLGLMSRAFAEFKPDAAFHLAARSLVRYGYREPHDTITTNVVGTLNFLECLRQARDVKASVVVTSDKCYENNEDNHPFAESDPMGGHDPYSSSKGCAELVAAAYRNAYFSVSAMEAHQIGLATARGGNVIGGGDWAEDRLIPDAVRAWTAGETLEVRNPHATRPWQHVLELVQGYLILAENLYRSGASYAEPWNFGPDTDSEKPVRNVLDLFSKYWGTGSVWTYDHGDHPYEANWLSLDITKSKTRLNWHPRWNLEHGLRKTADWYKAHLEGKNMNEFSLAQIVAYEDAASPGYDGAQDAATG